MGSYSFKDFVNNKMKEERSRLSTEMIADQLNDAVIPRLVSVFSRLKECVVKKNLRSRKLFGSFEGKKLIEELDSILSERFGFNFKTVYCSGCLYAIMTAPPPGVSGLFGNYQEVFDYLNKKYKHAKDMKYDDVSNVIRDEGALYKSLLNNMKLIQKQMQSDKVIVDLNKACIRNLPKDYGCNTLCDLDQAFLTFNFTPEEMTAVVLHEVGHGFTAIEYSYRYLSNTCVLIDTFVENCYKKNKSPRESLILSYAKATGDTSFNNADKSSKGLSLEIAIAHNFFNDMYAAKHNYSAIDKEQLADQFSGKFGMSAHLSSALDKVFSAYGDKYFNYGVSMSMSIFFSTFSVFLATMLTAPISTIFMFLGFITLVTNILLISNDTGIVLPSTYDADLQRLKRIRNQTVRLIRASDLDKSVAKQLLEDIDRMDNTIAHYSKLIPSVFTNLYTFFSKTGKNKLEMREIEKLTENLMANNLYVASAKLKYS